MKQEFRVGTKEIRSSAVETGEKKKNTRKIRRITRKSVRTAVNQLKNNLLNSSSERWENGGGVEQSLKDNTFTYSVWAKLYKIQFIGDTRFHEEYHINEDSLFIFELLCKKPIFIGINKGLYYYRVSSDSLSRQKFSENYFDILSIANIKYGIVLKKFPELLNLAENMKLKAVMNLLQILALRTKKEYRNEEKELLKYVKQNRSFYISATKENDKWLFILTHHLYYIYKMAVLIRGQK